MKRSFVFLILLLSLQLSACSKDSEPSNSKPNGFSIIGGDSVLADSTAAKFTVLLYNKSSDTFCTGSLIKKSVVLTAAHCLPETPDHLMVAFGVQPKSGAYKPRRVQAIIVHPEYSAEKTAQNDLALLHLFEAAPSHIELLHLPDEDFPLEEELLFTALGFGRANGTLNSIPANGELRKVILKISNFSTDLKTFFVNQSRGKGICNGDSGGPAVMTYQKKNYVVGIASAIFWRTPKNLTEEQLEEHKSKIDQCADRSIYMNVQRFLPWLQSALLQFRD